MKSKAVILAAACLSLVILAALLAPVLATHNPTEIRLSAEYLRQPPSGRHLFGTDELGRDLWSRTLYGARLSLGVGAVAMLISVFCGTALGAVAGYFGGIVDQLLMRATDIMLAVPLLLVLIILGAVTEPGVLGIALVLGLSGWMRLARLIRGQVLALRETAFVEAARSLGYSDSRVIFFHIIPNTKAVLTVNAVLTVAYAILAESALGFLGFGVQPPLFSWGSMLNAAQDIVLLRDAPWIAFFPGMAIFITILALNVLGSGLRDVLDPKCGDAAGKW